MPQDTQAPAIRSSFFRHLIKYSYLIGSLSILISSSLFTTYLFAYPFRSNVCNGLTGSGSLSDSNDYLDFQGVESRCIHQVTARGYKSTTKLVEGGLLPKDWAAETAVAAACLEKAEVTVQADREACAAVTALNDATACNAVKKAADQNANACEYKAAHTRYDLCEYNTDNKECVEAEPASADCGSAEENGRRKHRWGTDGKCEALKAPEICRQTGFLDANTAKAQEDLAIQGASAEAAAIILLVTASLAVLQTLNYHWHCLTSPCWGGCTHCCETFGQPCGCDIGYVVCGCPMECMKSGECRGCIAKENIVRNDDPDGFKNKYEAATIFLSFFVHNVLITVFGIYGKIARDHVEDQCFSVVDPAGCGATADLGAATPVYKCVYGTSGTPAVANTAKDFLASLTGSGNSQDAKTHMEQRGNVYDVALVFWWINTICFGLQLIAYLLSHERSVDMDMVAIRTSEDLCCGDISADDQNNIRGNRSQNYNSVPQSPGPETVASAYRKVQLRGNF